MNVDWVLAALPVLEALFVFVGALCCQTDNISIKYKWVHIGKKLPWHLQSKNLLKRYIYLEFDGIIYLHFPCPIWDTAAPQGLRCCKTETDFDSVECPGKQGVMWVKCPIFWQNYTGPLLVDSPEFNDNRLPYPKDGKKNFSFVPCVVRGTDRGIQEPNG